MENRPTPQLDIRAVDRILRTHAEEIFAKPSEAGRGQPLRTIASTAAAAVLLLLLAAGGSEPPSQLSGIRGSSNALSAAVDPEKGEISWKALRGASHYTIEIWSADGHVLLSETLSGESRMLRVPFLRESREAIYWSVTAWERERPLGVSGPFRIAP